MKLINLTFGEDQLPDEVTTTMTLKEAIWIAKVTGAARGSTDHHDIYDCLVGSVFNCYWEDGVNDAVRENPVTVPSVSAPADDAHVEGLRQAIREREATIALADRLIAEAVNVLTGENNEEERAHMADTLVDFQNREAGI